MTPSDAAPSRTAEPIEGTLEKQRPIGVDERLSTLADHVRDEGAFESTWPLLHYGLFPGLTVEDAAAHFAAWCHRQGLEPTFELRNARIGHLQCYVVYVRLAVHDRAGS